MSKTKDDTHNNTTVLEGGDKTIAEEVPMDEEVIAMYMDKNKQGRFVKHVTSNWSVEYSITCRARIFPRHGLLVPS